MVLLRAKAHVRACAAKGKGCGPARRASELVSSMDMPGEGAADQGAKMILVSFFECTVLRGCGPAHPASDVAGSLYAPGWLSHDLG